LYEKKHKAQKFCSVDITLIVLSKKSKAGSKFSELVQSNVLVEVYCMIPMLWLYVLRWCQSGTGFGTHTRCKTWMIVKSLTNVKRKTWRTRKNSIEDIQVKKKECKVM